MYRASHVRVVLLFCLVAVTGLVLNLALAQDQAPAPAASAAPALKPTDCMGCHDGTVAGMSAADREPMVDAVPADWKPTRPRANAKRAGVSLTVDLEKMKTSVHGAECLNCHAEITKLNHPAKLSGVDCNSCHFHDEVAASYQSGIHAELAARGNANAPVCADCHSAHRVVSGSDAASPVNRANVAATCGQCHTTRVLPGRTRTGAYDRWLGSIHAQKRNGAVNATCSDCHDSHGGRYATGPTAKVSVSKTCGKCHEKQRADYETGIHGAALAQGDLSSPNCVDCHGAHNVLPRSNPNSPVHGYNAVRGVCGECHSAQRINERYGLQNATPSYGASYHGLALKKGDLRSADCASCHGAHLILNSADPRSALHKNNLQKTCGTCHPDIGSGVTRGKVHPTLSRTAATLGEQVQWWVRWAYLLLIPGVLGFMVIHNLLDWIKKIRQHLARHRLEGEFIRLDLAERIAHIVLMASFSTLVISGFALTFGWQIPGLSGSTNEIIRAYAHRIAAIVMILWFVYHMWWIVFTKRGRGYVLDMLPNIQDGFDIMQHFLYTLGLRDEKPRFERFSYIEKMEYLAMMWGTVVMVVTGAILWFEEPMLKLLPLWGLDVAHIVHLMEAILATLAIIIWHFYSVLFNPDVAPMATHWLTGRLTEEEMEHEHPRELDRIRAAERKKALAEQQQPEEQGGARESEE